MKQSIVQKYNVPGPRYTSYPTVPYWDEAGFDRSIWQSLLIRSFDESNSSEGISIYIHLPFCESLCTFCGCNKRITKRHDVEEVYIEALLREWEMYVAMLDQTPQIKELHLGGGTPTFFRPQNLRSLIDGIFASAHRAPGHEYSFEGHPNNTTKEHLETLFELGFTRVSFGVQEYDPVVQKAIHRIQPFENVENVTRWAREIGYHSISHDLVFGLPFQTLDNVRDTIGKTKLLDPDRISFYSYAHVPWIKGNGQRGFDEANLPRDDEKRMLYEVGKELLFESGYREVGMDHFAKPDDSLYEAFRHGRLHRNFMGYSASKTQVMIGLGVSAIGDTWYGFGQNEKNLEQYYGYIERDELPITRGHILTDEDLVIRRHILNLMCRFETSWSSSADYFPELPSVLESLREMQSDGLLEFVTDGMVVTEAGKHFVRNICMAFDLRLRRKAPETKIFSMTI